MRILYVTHHYLSDNGGGTFASRAYINAFAEIADEMTLLYPVKEGQNLFREINSNIRLVPITYSKSKYRKMFDLCIGRVHRYYRVAPKFIKSGEYDIVVFDNSKTSFRLIDFSHKWGCKVVVIHHNYEYEYIRDNSVGIRRPLDLYWVKRYECAAVQKADINLTLSMQDIDSLSKKYCNNRTESFRLLGVFEYCRFNRSVINELSLPHTHFVITGNLSAVQTVKSLSPWITQYYPVIKNVIPDALLTIAGKKPGKSLVDLCGRYGINLIASPKCMDSILSDASCYICPVNMGGGVKLRVMDGLKNGLPVISHEVSVRGYDMFVKQGIIMPYHDVDSFRKALIRYKETKFLRKEIYRIYNDILSFDAGVDRLKAVLDKMACR